MRKPSALQIACARRLLAREAEGSVDSDPIVGTRVYETTFERLAVLIGAAATRALFARCVKLAAAGEKDFPLVELTSSDAQGVARQIVDALAPSGETEARHVAVFAELIALLEGLIGERLTANVLRDAWDPTQGPAPKETKQ